MVSHLQTHTLIADTVKLQILGTWRNSSIWPKETSLSSTRTSGQSCIRGRITPCIRAISELVGWRVTLRRQPYLLQATSRAKGASGAWWPRIWPAASRTVLGESWPPQTWGVNLLLWLSTVVATSGTMCPGVRLRVLQKWGGTGEGPEDAFQDEAKGPKHMTCYERLGHWAALASWHGGSGQCHSSLHLLERHFQRGWSFSL